MSQIKAIEPEPRIPADAWFRFWTICFKQIDKIEAARKGGKGDPVPGDLETGRQEAE